MVWIWKVGLKKGWITWKWGRMLEWMNGWIKWWRTEWKDSYKKLMNKWNNEVIYELMINFKKKVDKRQE